MKIKVIAAVSATLLFAGSITSCGVRGNPEPPLTPPELGHGEPGFKRASEEFAFPNVPSPTPVIVPGESRSQEEIR